MTSFKTFFMYMCRKSRKLRRVTGRSRCYSDATCCNRSLSSHFVLFKLRSVCAQSTSAEMKGVFLSVLILHSYCTCFDDYKAPSHQQSVLLIFIGNRAGPCLMCRSWLPLTETEYLHLTTQLQLPKQGQALVSCLISTPQTFKVSLCFWSSDQHEPGFTWQS